MNLSSLFCFAIFFASASTLPHNWSSNYNTYKRHRVYEVQPKSRQEVDILRKWMLKEPLFDFWKEPAKNQDTVHIMVQGKQEVRLVTLLRKYGFNFKIYLDHLDKEINKFVSKETKRRANKHRAFDLNDFNTLDDIMFWLENDLMSQCADSGFTCTIDHQLRSLENRSMPVLTMSSGGTDKPVYLIDAAIHAREWLSPATLFKIMDHMSRGNGNELLDNNDFVFMPMLNPDGYEYSWTNERLWRKNRRLNDDSECYGVDLNRNGDYMWGLEGVSPNPCSETYGGTGGNSEPEMQALDSILEQYSSRQRAYITIHTYGYMWMHSWGNTVDNAGEVCERTPDHDDLFAVANATANAIEATHGTDWARGNGCEVIYETTGATDDYAKAVRGWKYTFTPELRGIGFIVAPSEIQPSFEEVWNGLLAKEIAIEANPPQA